MLGGMMMQFLKLQGVIVWIFAVATFAAPPPHGPAAGAGDKGAAEAAGDAAGGEGKEGGAGDAAKEGDKPGDEAVKKSVTHHAVVLGGQKVEYTATAGMHPLKDAEGKVKANIFYIAYTKTGVNSQATRPLTFSFNGGPGSSSVWLHLGILGPRRVKFKDEGFGLPPPYELVENEYSLLDETDLVFIDPVGTGYSRATKPENASGEFYGIEADARAIGEFIRAYTSQNSRWLSPKFLIGESYGTTRAAALSGELLEQHRMNLNGIMLVSTVLNFQTIRTADGNDLPYILFLPSYTAAAWYHKVLAADLLARPLPEVLKEAEAFAVGAFSRALLLGASLPAAERTAVVKEMARLTGLKEAYVEAANLRVPLSRFNAELLRDRRLVIGRFDCRYTSLARDPLSTYAERDPSADQVFSAFASTFNHYVRNDLAFEDERPYNILADVGRWDWGAENHFANVAETLAESMSQNPFLKVHVSNGFYDMATPYFASRHTFNTLTVHPDLMKNIVQDDYTAGHMMYLNLPDLKKQKADLAKFIREASKQAP